MAPRGCIASVLLDGTPTAPGTGTANETPNVFTDTAWIEFATVAGRAYVIEVSPITAANSSFSAQEMTYRLTGISITGQAAGVTGVLMECKQTVDNNLATTPLSATLVAVNTTTQRVQLQAGRDDEASITFPNQKFAMRVYDVGLDADAGDVGALGSATGGATLTGKYLATSSRSYDTDGVYIGSPDGDDFMYTGQLTGRTHGNNEKSLWCFDGDAIRDDLDGKTLISAEVWMYCVAGQNPGTAGVNSSWSTDTAPPTAFPGTGASNTNHGSAFSYPGWGSFSIVGDELDEILTNGANCCILQLTALVGSAEFRGYTDPDLRPFIKAVYQ